MHAAADNGKLLNTHTKKHTQNFFWGGGVFSIMPKNLRFVFTILEILVAT